MSSDIFQQSAPPLGLSPNVSEARQMFSYASMFFLLAGIVSLLWGIWRIVQGLFFYNVYYYSYSTGISTGAVLGGIITMAFGVISFIIKKKADKDLIGALDEGRIADVTSKSMLYVILGILFGYVIGGIFIFLGDMKLKEQPTQSAPQHKCSTCGQLLVYMNQYQRWYCNTCQKYAPAAPSAPSPAPPPSQQYSQAPPPPTG